MTRTGWVLVLVLFAEDASTGGAMSSVTGWPAEWTKASMTSPAILVLRVVVVPSGLVYVAAVTVQPGAAGIASSSSLRWTNCAVSGSSRPAIVVVIAGATPIWSILEPGSSSGVMSKRMGCGTPSRLTSSAMDEPRLAIADAMAMSLKVLTRRWLMVRTRSPGRRPGCSRLSSSALSAVAFSAGVF